MLIRHAELDFGACRADVRVRNGCIREIGDLTPAAGESEVDAAGGALLPSLHDHHVHLCALAAADASLRATPADVGDAHGFAAALRVADTRLPAGEWLRAMGFDDAVMAGSGMALDRHWLDRVLPQRPVRVQHRSGRRWTFNSAALERLDIRCDGGRWRTQGTPLTVEDGAPNGHLLDGDTWLRERLPAVRPDLSAVSRRLWAWGVTQCTDTSHSNTAEDFAAFAAAQLRGELLQDLTVMGDASLDAVEDRIALNCVVRRGAHKFHLHDHALPDFDRLCADIRRAHHAARNVAFHCVTRVDLTFALAALRASGVRPGDRIEHASVTPPEALQEIVSLGLAVATQPAFIAERGDRYLAEVAGEDLPWLYRVRSLMAAGVPVVLSSDAPYGSDNPWQSMAAAVARRSASGHVLGPDEAIDAATALRAWSGGASHSETLAVGGAANLCLLPVPWAQAARNLGAVEPRATWKAGRDARTITCSE